MKKILVIEDEMFIRMLMLDMLETENFQAIGAENGEVGVQLAREQIPDLIFCDIMMPIMNGHQVITKLREDPVTASIPFIFLTAKADRADMLKSMELGAKDYLVKPFTNSQLLSTISKWLPVEASSAHDKEGETL